MDRSELEHLREVHQLLGGEFPDEADPSAAPLRHHHVEQLDGLDVEGLTGRHSMMSGMTLLWFLVLVALVLLTLLLVKKFRASTASGGFQRDTRRSRSAFPTTETELKDMAAAAMMGLRRIPKNGYRTPAAMGTPRAL